MDVFVSAGTKTHGVGEYLTSALQGFYIALGFAVIPALMATNVVKERETSAKRMQLIMGLSTPSYWLATWAWDFILYTLPWFGASILVYVIGSDTYKGTNFVALFFLLGAFGASVPGLTYTLSFAFKTSAMAQTAIMGIYSLLTMVLFFASFLLDYPSLGLPAVAGDVVKYTAMLFPCVRVVASRGGSLLLVDVDSSLLVFVFSDVAQALCSS